MAKALTSFRCEMVERNIPLVRYIIAKEFHRVTTVSYEDMLQAGCEGLARAAVDWDPEKGAFSTYAAWWIRQRLYNELRTASAVHLTKGQHDRRHGADAVPAPVCFSLDAASDGTGGEYGADGFEDVVLDGCLMQEVDRALRRLPGRWEAVVRMTWGIGCDRLSQREAGRRLGISGQRVEQIQRKAYGRMREDPCLRAWWEAI